MRLKYIINYNNILFITILNKQLLYQNFAWLLVCILAYTCQKYSTKSNTNRY